MRIALWQTAGFAADPPANLRALERVALAAAAAGAQLLLTPECWLCGYNIGGAVAQLAEYADGAAAQRIATIAAGHSIAIAYGYAERDRSSPRIFNAAQVIAADGTALAHYRKTHLFGPAERTAYEPGACLVPPFEIGGLRMGLLICYDIEFPETARALMLAGAEVLLVPTALTDEYAAVPSVLVAARAIENQLFVAYCNHAGVENGMRFLGGSCLSGPDGHPIVAAGAGEALLLGEISRQTQLAAAGLYPYRADRRPELYRPLAPPAASSPQSA